MTMTFNDDLFSQLPAVPFGAVYFRKSNPPREDWERDYEQAKKDGMNTFRHWFIWAGIEVAPGIYDWDDYDRQFDLAAKYGIKTIIAEILAPAPDWLFAEYPHARVEDERGRKAGSGYRDACAVGGMPGLCFDNEEVFSHARQFLTALYTRYKDHPGLGGYDIWNEQNTNGSAGGCYCEASAQKFREWVKQKYGDMKLLADAWKRYSYRDWDDIEIPRHRGFYGDEIDWRLFRIENAYGYMKWRRDLIKSIDPDHPVTAHMNAKKTLSQVGSDTYQIFRAARLSDGFGFSGGSNHSEWTRYRWEHWLTSDLVRSASDEKPYWCAEMPAGYSWRSKGTPMDRGRMATPNDIRLFSMTSFAGGATGIKSPRWRPLLNGWHTGNFGFYDMAGLPTDRSRMAAEVAKWANHPDQADIWKARPVKAEIGMVVVPESQIQCWLLENDTKYYYHSVAGAYQGFLFNNIQVDFVNFDEITDGTYDILYLPHPLMLPRRVAEDLREFVRRGGTLISEGCPAYFGDHGRAGETQPNYGLQDLFGAVEAHVEFTPVLHEDLKFQAGGKKISGGVYLQSYTPKSGTVTGTFEDGSPAVIDHTYGQGKTRLIGTCPGYGYYEAEDDPASREYFGNLLRWAGRTPHVKCSDHRLVARLHQGDVYRMLWIVNSSREPIRAELELAEEWGPFNEYEILLSNGTLSASGASIQVIIPDRDVALVRWS